MAYVCGEMVPSAGDMAVLHMSSAPPIEGVPLWPGVAAVLLTILEIFNVLFLR